MSQVTKDDLHEMEDRIQASLISMESRQKELFNLKLAALPCSNHAEKIQEHEVSQKGLWAKVRDFEAMKNRMVGARIALIATWASLAAVAGAAWEYWRSSLRH